MRNVIHLKV